MFEQLFKRSDALARHRNCPLGEERNRYLSYCANQGMSRSTLLQIAEHLLIITDALRLGERPNELITPTEIAAEATRRAKRRKLGSQRRRKHTKHTGPDALFSHATHWLKFLGRLQSPPVSPRPYADHVAAFADHLARERGLSSKLIRRYSHIAQDMLDRVCASRRFEEVTPAQVDDALVHKHKESGCARVTIRADVSALRVFFRFAQKQGWCHNNLAQGIRGPRVFSQESLPRGPSWVEVQRLLASVGVNTPKAIRDRAILYLLAVYGCRASEVVRLRLGDIDWEQELIHFTRSKSSRTQSFPLSRAVGDAILRYLQDVRPRSEYREIFLRRLAPIRPLSSQSLWCIVAQRLRSVNLSLRHFGPHSLRHACATHLLEQGFTLKQIGDQLGHRHPDSTRIYAKVDLGGLRRVADFDIGDLL
jgi:integrase/recombinase XerD